MTSNQTMSSHVRLQITYSHGYTCTSKNRVNEIEDPRSSFIHPSCDFRNFTISSVRWLYIQMVILSWYYMCMHVYICRRLPDLCTFYDSLCVENGYASLNNSCPRCTRYHDVMYCKLMEVTVHFRSYSSHRKESHPNIIIILTSFFRGQLLQVNLGIIPQDQYEQGLSSPNSILKGSIIP